MGKLIKWIVALAVMYGVFLFSGYGCLSAAIKTSEGWGCSVNT